VGNYCFLQDSLDVVGDGGLAVGEGIEVAVAAFPNAERDMDVETFQSTPPVRPDPSTTFGMTRTSLLHFKEQEKRFLWISTEPTIFIFFLPSACFSSSLRLRVISPP